MNNVFLTLVARRFGVTLISQGAHGAVFSCVSERIARELCTLARSRGVITEQRRVDVFVTWQGVAIRDVAGTAALFDQFRACDRSTPDGELEARTLAQRIAPLIAGAPTCELENVALNGAESDLVLALAADAELAERTALFGTRAPSQPGPTLDEPFA